MTETSPSPYRRAFRDLDVVMSGLYKTFDRVVYRLCLCADGGSKYTPAFRHR